MTRQNKHTILKKINGFKLIDLLLIVGAIISTVAKFNSLIVISLLLVDIVVNFISKDFNK